MAEEVNEFDIMRQRIAERQGRRAKEGRQQARQDFSSRGLLQSGGAIKAERQAEQQAALQAQEERRDVLVAEAGVRRAEREAQKAREFQTQERLGAQQFQSQERIGTQQFASQEREAQNAFAAAEAALNRQFTSDERVAAEAFALKTQEDQQAFQQTLFNLESDLKKELQTNQLNQEQEQFLIDQALKTQIADKQAKQFEASLEQSRRQFDAEFGESIKSIKINAINSLKNSGFSIPQINQILADTGIITDPSLGVAPPPPPPPPPPSSNIPTQPSPIAGRRSPSGPLNERIVQQASTVKLPTANEIRARLPKIRF